MIKIGNWRIITGKEYKKLNQELRNKDNQIKNLITRITYFERKPNYENLLH